jgi:Peptidase family S41
MKHWIVALACVSSASAVARNDAAAADFDRLWHAIRDEYAYLDECAVDWDRVRAVYRPRFLALPEAGNVVPLLERVLDELYEPHAQLNCDTSDSYRLTPSGADVHARFVGGDVTIDAVRPGSSAEAAGVRVGMHVVTVDGSAIESRIRDRLGECLARPALQAHEWALASVLAGRHSEVRRWGVESDGALREITIDESMRAAPPSSPLAYELRGDAVGYIRIHDSLGDAALVPAFDDALAALRDTKCLMIDLRDTSRGGNTTVARSLLGRFVDRELPYQKHELVAEERAFGVKRSWLELVSPRGPFRYAGSVAVLVGPFTGSMGEGMAIAFDAIDRGVIVGSRMAGLRGALGTVHLSASDIIVSFPIEKLSHVDGTPREAFVPRVRIDPLATPQPDGDPAYSAALAFLANNVR